MLIIEIALGIVLAIIILSVIGAVADSEEGCGCLLAIIAVVVLFFIFK